MTEVIKVQGMGCNNCVQAIETSVGEISGVSHVKAYIDKAEVKVELEDTNLLAEVKETIEEQGYDVVS